MCVIKNNQKKPEGDFNLSVPYIFMIKMFQNLNLSQDTLLKFSVVFKNVENLLDGNLLIDGSVMSRATMVDLE